MRLLAELGSLLTYLAATYCTILGVLYTAKGRPIVLLNPHDIATTHCNTLQHTCLQHKAGLLIPRNTQQRTAHTAKCCNTLLHTAAKGRPVLLLNPATTHCNTRHHTATHCTQEAAGLISQPCNNTLQHTATLCYTLQPRGGRSYCSTHALRTGPHREASCPWGGAQVEILKSQPAAEFTI